MFPLIGYENDRFIYFLFFIFQNAPRTSKRNVCYKNVSDFYNIPIRIPDPTVVLHMIDLHGYGSGDFHGSTRMN